MKTNLSLLLFKRFALIGISVVLVCCNSPVKEESKEVSKVGFKAYSMGDLKADSTVDSIAVAEEALSVKKLIDPSCTGQSCISFNSLKEDSLDLTDFEKDKDQVQIEYDNFYDMIKTTDDLVGLDTMPNVIRASAIFDLLDKLAELPADLRGLQIWFGLSGNKVIFIYQPVTMAREVSAGDGWYDVSAYGPCYEYDVDANVFKGVDLTVTDTGKLFTNYRNKIRIANYRHPSNFYSMINDGTWRSDTRAVTFSFQEILWVYQNTYPCSPENTNYCNYLYFYNGAAVYRNNAFSRRKLKHTIFITPKPLDKLLIDDGIIVLPKDAGNLAHLCPPSCDKLYYEIIKR